MKVLGTVVGNTCGILRSYDLPHDVISVSHDQQEF